ncbi:transglycosylase domain-containing protein [Litorimonas haliclonae]|uniref:transglycosylase domain-containing protein n=1 Tax=Litorimonas haliclonae TaxID=2081977 RepID=UPI0039EFC02C
MREFLTSLRFPDWQPPALPPRIKSGLKFAAVGVALTTYICGMAGFGAFALAARDLPDPKRLWENQRPVSVQIVDRQGRDILVRGATVAPRVKVDQLPFHIPLVMLAVEDRRYFSHIGVDPEALSRAVVANLKAGRYVQGGSTLTQQLSKNVFLSPDKTLRRKAQEMMMALWLERSFTKEEILELYLSKVYFGSGAWGLEAASKRYFDKPAAKLNLPETAMLAGLLKAPSAYNPVNNPDKAAARTKVVLDILRDQNIIDAKMYETSLRYPIRIHRPQSDNSAQYFVDWIWSDIERVLGGPPGQDVVVQTTLDMTAQSYAQRAVSKHLDKDRRADQAALVSLDGTGAVIAMIGGASYSENQFNRAVNAERQPGSAFKPFVYLTAMEAGMSPWDMQVDAPITIKSRIDSWSPRNFKKEYAGNILLEDAFAKSINTVAVSIAEDVGRERVVATAERFGLGPLKPLRSVSLGAQTTTPLHLTRAYLPFSNWGKMAEPYGIISISTAEGSPLYDAATPELTPVMDLTHLAQMNRLMMHTVESGTGGRARIPERDIGGKTGTTNDFRDAWFVGYHPDLVTGVWVGNDENAPMKRVTGGTIPTEIFHDYMEGTLQFWPKSELMVATEPNRVTQQRSRKDRSLDTLLQTIENTLP